MASFCFGLISILMLSIAWAAQNFVPVSVCPRDRDNWNLESVRKNCQGDTPDYLCAAIENQVGNFGEICTKFGLTPANKCAVLNEQTHNLDSVDCKADSGCPAQPYIPSVLWQYQICFEDFYGTTTSLAPSTTPTIIISTPAASSRPENGGSGAEVVVPVLIILIIVAVVVIVVFYRRNQYGFRDKVRQLYTDLRQRFLRRDHRENVQISDEAENGEAQSSHVPLLVQNVIDVKENETNLEKTVYAKPEQTIPTKKEKVTNTSNTSDTKEGHKEKTVYAKPEKTKTKKEKVTNTSNTSDTKEGHKGKHDEIEKKIAKLEELLKYLVHILKQELDVNDLKEKVVIHSKSINEHFAEPLLKDMQYVRDVNDFSRLDISLVLTLLRNFCEGIKPSSKGWDYEPPDDETHVGADIERIRFMWNKHCDDDFEFKHLDDVYNRMKQKYGTVAVHGDDGNRKPPHIKDKENTEVVPGGDGIGKPPHKKEENKEVVHGDDGNEKLPHTDQVLGLDGNRKPPHKDKENTEVMLGGDGNQKPIHKDKESSKGLGCMKKKMPSIKLNEDCTVEKGIVITENITNALKILKSRHVVILKGVIGCGKTHALKAIENHFQERKWKMAWIESENFEGEISHEKQTIFLCDNLFGKFGASVFSQDAVNKTEKALKEIESSKETKVVIGIHTHVYDEVKKNLKLDFLDQKNITVEMDKLSNAEALLIFKEQLKKGHCKMDDDCWFKTVGFQSVLDKLSKNQGHIGGPFLSLMYCNQHELFSDEAFSVNPVQTLMQYIGNWKQASRTLYDCLVYLMCVQQHNIEAEPAKWAGYISVDITKDNLKYLAKTSGLLHVDTKIATLAHELLTTVIFKSAAGKIEIFFPVLQMCESEVFLQLLRPPSSHSDLYFEYIHDLNPNSRDVGRLCTYRLARMYKKQEINHPFKTVELFKEKYEKYSTHKPKKLSLIRVTYE